MVNIILSVHGIERYIQTRQRIVITAVVVSTLRIFTDTIKAIDLEVGSERQSRLERVHPFSGDKLVVLNLLGCMRYTMGVRCLNHLLEPGFCVAEEKRQAVVDGNILLRHGRIGVAETNEGAKGDVLAR